MPTSATTTQPGLAPEASPANLYDLVAGAVRTSPHRVAVGTADGNLELSYRELDVAVGEFAVRLARFGVGPGDAIALSCDNSMEFVPTLLAAASIGVAVAPLDPALPPSSLMSRVAAVHARTVIVAAHLYDGSMAALAAPGWVRQECRSESFSSASFRLPRRKSATAGSWRPGSAHLEVVNLLPALECLACLLARFFSARYRDASAVSGEKVLQSCSLIVPGRPQKR